jgi:hypothetical protein
MPLIVAVPLSGTSNVASALTTVVLPAPFGPSNPYILPLSTCRSIPSRALTSPKYFLSFLTTITGSFVFFLNIINYIPTRLAK